MALEKPEQLQPPNPATAQVVNAECVRVVAVKDFSGKETSVLGVRYNAQAASVTCDGIDAPPGVALDKLSIPLWTLDDGKDQVTYLKKLILETIKTEIANRACADVAQSQAALIQAVADEVERRQRIIAPKTDGQGQGK